MNLRPPRLYSFGRFQIDTEEGVLLRDGQPLIVEPKVLSLLIVLVENGSRLVPKDELMRRVWPDTIVEENNLSVGVCKLRKVLGPNANHTSWIQTVPRRGYRFVAGMTERRRPEDPRTLAGSLAGGSQETAASNGHAAKRTLAVFPFAFIGPEKHKHLGLGIANSLITRLSTLPRTAVKLTSTVSWYKGARDPAQAGRELDVELILEGCVQESGKRTRVTAQLVSVVDGSLLWAGKFDESTDMLFDLEDSVSEQVANALRVTLVGDNSPRTVDGA